MNRPPAKNPGYLFVPIDELGPELAALQKLRGDQSVHAFSAQIARSGLMSQSNARNILLGKKHALRGELVAKLHAWLVKADPEYAAARPVPLEGRPGVRADVMAALKKKKSAPTKGGRAKKPAPLVTRPKPADVVQVGRTGSLSSNHMAGHVLSVVMQRTITSTGEIPADANELVERWAEDAIRFVLREAHRESK